MEHPEKKGRDVTGLVPIEGFHVQLANHRIQLERAGMMAGKDLSCPNLGQKRDENMGFDGRFAS